MEKEICSIGASLFQMPKDKAQVIVKDEVTELQATDAVTLVRW